MPEEEFFAFLQQRKNLLDGVVICGGEPTINPDLEEFISRIKEMGFNVKLDTNGSNPEMLKTLIQKNLLDYIAMDVKAPLKTQKLKSGVKNDYEKAVGVEVDLDKIKESIKIIKNSGINYEFRTTVVPDFHTEKDIVEIAKNISPAKKYFLQNFQSGKNLNSLYEKKDSYQEEFLEKIVDKISLFFEECKLR